MLMGTPFVDIEIISRLKSMQPDIIQQFNSNNIKWKASLRLITYNSSILILQLILNQPI